MTSLYRVDGIPVTKMVSSDERKVNRFAQCLRCKKGKTKSRCFCNGLLVCLCKLDSAGYFTRTQATGAGVDVARSTINNCLHTSYIWFPSSVRSSVRMRNLNTESNAFSADIAFSHVSAPPLSDIKEILFWGNSGILSDSPHNCKHFSTLFSRNCTYRVNSLVFCTACRYNNPIVNQR